MYWIIDGLCFMLGLAQFILALVGKMYWSCWIGIVWIVVYPLLLEAICNLAACLIQKKVTYSGVALSHIVYSHNYNITFLGVQRIHPFDSQKYGNIFKKLVDRKIINESEVIVPQRPSRGFLIEKMSKWYLLKLCYSLGVCRCIEVPLIFVPGFLMRWRVLNPMLLATQGSILAACAAEKIKWAVNLSGGYHHASFNSGGGFCVYPDISLMVHYLRTRLNKRRIMIIDLDAHQGNGYERDLVDDAQTYIVDFYNHRVYPNDNQAKRAIRKDVVVHSRMADDEYLRLVDEIQIDLDNFCPQFIIYNAGTDILSADPIGRLNISANGIIARDQAVIRMCVRRNMPVVMLLSGGYQKINAEIIANSIQNLIEKYN